jgi:hypothetical protein
MICLILKANTGLNILIARVRNYGDHKTHPKPGSAYRARREDTGGNRQEGDSREIAIRSGQSYRARRYPSALSSNNGSHEEVKLTVLWGPKDTAPMIQTLKRTDEFVYLVV